MSSTRWYILAGVAAWALSCVAIFYYAADAALSRAMSGQQLDASSTGAVRPLLASAAATRGSHGSARRRDHIQSGDTIVRQLREAAASVNSEFGAAAMRESAGAFTLTEIRQAIEEIDAMPRTQARDRMMCAVLSRWVELEPEAAVALARGQSNRALREVYLKATLGVWYSEDPAAAMTHATSLMRDAADEELILFVVNGFGLHGGLRDTYPNVDETLRFLTSYDFGVADDVVRHWYREGGLDEANVSKVQTRLFLLRWATEGLFFADPDRLIAWADALPDDEVRQSAVKRIGSRWSEYDPGGAFAWLSSHDVVDERVIKRLVGSWGWSDPAGAMDWYSHLPEELQHAEGKNEILSSWAYQDPASAASWLVSQPASEELDQGVGRIANTLSANGRPDLGLEWAVAIIDSEERDTRIDKVMEQWLKKDPEAAVEYLQSAPLPEGMTDRLLRRAQEAVRDRNQ